MRDNSGNLVVKNVETFIRALLVAVAVGAAAAWLAPIPRTQALGWTAICVVFGAALTAADERSTFIFDQRRAVVVWKQETPFRHEGGEIPFSSITGLSLERDFARGTRRGGARRLVLLTTSGPRPVTTAFTGIGTAAEQTARAIQSYLAEVDPAREIPLV